MSRNRLPLGLSLYEGTALFLAFLAPGLGILLFGGVRLWSIGPLMILVFLAFLLYGVRDRVFRDAVFPLRIPPGGLVALAFVGYALLRIPFALVPYEAALQFLMILSAVVSYYLWTGMAGVGRRWKWILGGIILLMALSAGYAWIQHTQGVPYKVFWRVSSYGERVSGTYFCPNHLASELAMGLVLCVTLLFAPETGAMLKIIAGYGAAMMVGPLFLTQSRSGLLGALSGLAIAGLLMAWRKGKSRVLLAVLTLAVLAGAVGTAVWSGSPAWRKRILMAAHGEDIRLELWKNALTMIADKPWFGHGAVSYRDTEWRYLQINPGAWSKYVHNEYLHHLVEYGFVGFVLAAMFALTALVIFARLAVKARRERDAFLAAGATGAAVGALVHAFFDFNLHIYSVSMTLLMIAGTVASVLYTAGDLKPRAPSRALARGFALTAAVVALLGAFFATRAVASYAVLFSADRAQAAMDLNRRTQYEDQYREADRLYQLALRLDPANWRPYLGLGQIRKNRAAFFETEAASQARLAAEALVWYRAAEARNPVSEEVLHGMSHVYALNNDADQCLRYLQRLVELMPRRPFYHTRLGTQLVRMGRNAEAEKEFRRALELDSSDAAARLNLRVLTGAAAKFRPAFPVPAARPAVPSPPPTRKP